VTSQSAAAKLPTGLAIVAGMGVAGAPAASADEGMFLDEVHQKVDYPLTDAQAFSLGHTACDAIRDGINSGLSLGKSRAKADQAVGWAQNGMGLSMDLADGMFLTEAAEHQLC
jgi:hypothetical protein